MAKKLKKNLPKIRSRQVKELRGIFRHLKHDKGSVDEALKMYEEFEKKYEKLDGVAEGEIVKPSDQTIANAAAAANNNDNNNNNGNENPIEDDDSYRLQPPAFPVKDDDEDDVEKAILEDDKDDDGEEDDGAETESPGNSDWLSSVTSKIYGTVGSLLGSKKDLKADGGESAEELLEAVATEKEIEEISKEFNAKDRELSSLEESIRKDEGKLANDYGPDDVFFHMLDQCYKYETDE